MFKFRALIPDLDKSIKTMYVNRSLYKNGNYEGQKLRLYSQNLHHNNS